MKETRSHDKLSFSVINDLLNRYIEQTTFVNTINKTLKDGRKIRMPNFPSEISENLVKFCKLKQTGVLFTWNTTKGDLTFLDKLIEVKGFMSDGPISFGPTEQWDWIYFVDCRRFAEHWFTIYELRISNNSSEWKSISVNKTQTIGDQCLERRRPRIKFDNIINAIDDGRCPIIYQGPLLGLSPHTGLSPLHGLSDTVRK
jgi:hypothetical protein